jgi:hypothetical protein
VLSPTVSRNVSFLLCVQPTASASELGNQLPNQLPCQRRTLLAFAPMSSLATFCNVPVSAVFDSNASSSTVCLEWVINSGLRTRNSQASGLLSLPANAGFVSMYLNNLPVAASLPSDLVLGLDWFEFVCHCASETIVHLSSGPLELRRRPLPISAESSMSIGVS